MGLSRPSPPGSRPTARVRLALPSLPPSPAGMPDLGSPENETGDVSFSGPESVILDPLEKGLMRVKWFTSLPTADTTTAATMQAVASSTLIPHMNDKLGRAEYLCKKTLIRRAGKKKSELIRGFELSN